MKKIAALVLALVMVLSCGITGSATEFEKEDNRLISTENIEIKMIGWYIYRIKEKQKENHHEKISDTRDHGSPHALRVFLRLGRGREGQLNFRAGQHRRGNHRARGNRRSARKEHGRVRA